MLRLLLDAQINPRVAREVRRHRPESVIESLIDWRGGVYRETADERILTVAAQLGLTLVTYDTKTIAPLLLDWANSGRHHGGVVFIDNRTIRSVDVGALVRAIVRLLGEQGTNEWIDRAIYLRP